jgi:hypothetical protein
MLEFAFVGAVGIILLMSAVMYLPELTNKSRRRRLVRLAAKIPVELRCSRCDGAGKLCHYQESPARCKCRWPRWFDCGGCCATGVRHTATPVVTIRHGE